MPRLVEISSVVLEKRIFFLISSMHFYYFIVISPRKKAGALIHLYKLESPLPKVALILPSLVEIGPVVLEKNIFILHLCIFTIS